MINLQQLKETHFLVHDLPDEPVLDLNRPHIWFCNLDENQELKVDWHSILSRDELALAARLKNSLERRRFVNRSVFVRKVLGNLAGIAPEKVEYCLGPKGKPKLVNSIGINGEHMTRLNFNISHTENILALAVAFNKEVGIDLEVINPSLDFFAIAKIHFTPDDLYLLRSLQQSKALLGFYRLWTCKEALAKMHGSGITSWSAVESGTDSQCILYSFELNLDQKEIVGALVVGCETY